MSSKSLQQYLSVIDPILFPVLKTLRRSLSGLSWAISGDLAMYLYSYSSSLPSVNLPNPEIQIVVQISDSSDVSRLEAVLQDLRQHGFVEEDRTSDHVCLHYPLLSTHIKISYRKAALPVVWMRNLKGKSTYPLLEPMAVMEHKRKQINVMNKVERLTEWDTYNWMKDVVNHVIIE